MLASIEIVKRQTVIKKAIWMLRDALVVFRERKSSIADGCRHDPGKFEQFCACGKATSVITRFWTGIGASLILRRQRVRRTDAKSKIKRGTFRERYIFRERRLLGFVYLLSLAS
jgi:hypothetical protein